MTFELKWYDLKIIIDKKNIDSNNGEEGNTQRREKQLF